MKKTILTILVAISLSTTAMGYGSYRTNSFSSESFPPPTIQLAE